MVYDTKNRILHIGVFEKVELTELENKILICLSSEYLADYKMISKYLYGFEDENSTPSIRAVVARIRKKTKKQLKIKTVTERGYVLKTEMYFK